MPHSQSPNVLFLHTDQQRYSALGCAGNDAIETPNLDRLAEDGVRFSSAYVQSPVCMPSRASDMTPGLFGLSRSTSETGGTRRRTSGSSTFSTTPRATTRSPIRPTGSTIWK